MNGDTLGVSRRKFTGALAAAAGVAALGLGIHQVSGSGATLVSGRPLAKPIASDPTLPSSADVVIVGGGVIAACTALFLAERGLSVALCEKGVVAGEASGRAAGYFESSFMPMSKMEIINCSRELWKEMNARVGADTGFRQTGLLSMFLDESGLEDAALWANAVKGEPGLDPHILNATSTKKLLNSPMRGVVGALFQATDGILEPRLATSVIAEGARARGATIHQHCAVRGIETEGGRVAYAVTELGTIKTNHVVVAGGLWSTLFCRNLGLDLPQLQAFASSASIDPLPQGPSISGGAGNVFWRNQADGGYLIGVMDAVSPINTDSFRYGLKFLPALRNNWGYIHPTLGSEFLRTLKTPTQWSLDMPSPFEEIRIFEPQARRVLLEDSLKRLAEIYPAFNEASIREVWGGALVSTPDNMPIISEVASIPGLFLGTGFQYGLAMAPAAGELLADLVMGRAPKMDPRGFRYERFSDGSNLQFHH